jgi:hypothetical protein
MSDRQSNLQPRISIPRLSPTHPQLRLHRNHMAAGLFQLGIVVGLLVLQQWPGLAASLPAPTAYRSSPADQVQRPVTTVQLT